MHSQEAVDRRLKEKPDSLVECKVHRFECPYGYAVKGFGGMWDTIRDGYKANPKKARKIIIKGLIGASNPAYFLTNTAPELMQWEQGMNKGQPMPNVNFMQEETEMKLNQRYY